MKRLAGILLFFVTGGCAHGPRAPDPAALKGYAETFHERVRWRDYRGAEELLVPERRDTFDAGRRQHHDERDLTITDYELEDVRFAPDGESANVVSRINWVRLPSMTEKSEEVTSLFVWRDRTWLLARQTGGPFADELGAPYTPPDDAGIH